MRLTDFSVDRPVAISMMILIAVVMGVVSLLRLGVDLMPDIDYPTLTMMVRYPGAPSEEVESIVARPYEAAVSGVSGVEKVQSISQEDVCYLLIDFAWGTDLDAAAGDVREAASYVEPYLPDDVERPVILKFSLTAFPEAIYAVRGMDDTARLRELLRDVAQPRFERLDGVAQASFFGGREEEIQVAVDRAALEGVGTDLDTIVRALRADNLDMPAGRQVHQRREVLLRTVGTYRSLDAVRDTVVGISRRTGAPVRLGAVARVRRGFRERRNLVLADGRESVMLVLMKEAGANPLVVQRAFLAELERVKKVLPEGIEFGRLMDIGKVIRLLVNSVVQNGVVGALLAIVIMYAFLRAVRPTLTIALVVPLSLLVTCIPIYLSGDTLNMMTMGGLVLGIGMLVDNAVVVIENIYRHIESGADRRTAAKRGAGEVGMAITASTLTTAVVFLPILFSQGLAGRLAKGLALTVAAALFSSLFVALTIVPMLARVFFSSRLDARELAGGARFRRFQARYERLLGWCLRHRGRTLGGVGALLVLTLGLVPFIGAEFMPPTDDPILMAKISFPIGTAMEETVQAVDRVTAVVRQFPDVELVGSMVGVDENDPTQGLSETNPAGVHEAVLFVRLRDKEDRQVPTNEALQALMRERFPRVEGMNVEFVPIGGAMGQSTHPIEVEVYGPDLDELNTLAQRVADRMRQVPGIVDVQSSLQVAKPERHVVVDRDRAAAFGLTTGQVAMAVKTATLGTVATRFREKGDEIDVRVRLAEADRATPEALLNILVPTPLGRSVRLGQVAHLEDGLGPVRIDRENQSRRVTVRANLEGVDLAGAMAAVQAAVEPLRAALPPGYDIAYGGQYQDMREAFGQLLGALVLAVLLVYMVMAAQFESFAHPFTIMFTMPLAIIGVLLAFFLTRTTLSVPSFLGVIMLAGIVVNNGIVMVDTINQLRAGGREILDAVATGAATRLRPVLITSLTTIFAMVPMAVSRQQGSETMGPLALTIIGGLSAATVFTLVVVPVVYILVDRLAARGVALWSRLVHPEEARPAG